VNAPRLVQFRPTFSDALVGLAWEVDNTRSIGGVDNTDGPNNGRAFIGLRRRVGKRQQWGYRLAYVTDLTNLDGTPFDPDEVTR
jgi:hypothetical protein